jgi:hypothetical protein
MPNTTQLVNRWKQLQESLVLQYNDLALSTLANMVESDTIDVSPRFQRRDRWSNAKQSQLIESFVLNLPIPPIYLAEEDGGTFSVIDGRQRLTAIKAFFDNTLTLSDLTELSDLNGLRISDLPIEIRASLSMRPLRSATLLRQTDPELKYLVFHRLNTAGEPLNAQEIRNVVYRGPLNDLLFELALDPYFRHQLKIDSDRAAAFRKMQDVEFVLRFLTLASSWQNFGGNLARSMDEFMADHQTDSGAALSTLSHLFRNTLRACEAIWGDLAFRRPDGAVWRYQALAGLFDAEMISASTLSPGQVAALARRQHETIDMTRSLFNDRDFDDAVRTGTNTPSRVRFRIERMSQGLDQVLTG